MPSRRTIPLTDEAATQALGRALAQLAQPGDVILLNGTLGMGKSTLARALIQSLMGEEEEVPSPTFTLVQTYDSDLANVWHFDLYRLEQPEDAFELGIEEAFIDGISLIEWPDRLGPYLPRQYLSLELDQGPTPGSRTALLVAHGQWEDRLPELDLPGE